MVQLTINQYWFRHWLVAVLLHCAYISLSVIGVTSIRISICEIRRSYDQLISEMGFPILVRRCLILARDLITTHIMMTSSIETFATLLALCEWKPPVTSGFLSQRPVTRSFGVSFDVRLNKRLIKQSRRWWFETPLRSLGRHRNTILGIYCTHRYTYHIDIAWVSNHWKFDCLLQRLQRSIFLTRCEGNGYPKHGACNVTPVDSRNKGSIVRKSFHVMTLSCKCIYGHQTMKLSGLADDYIIKDNVNIQQRHTKLYIYIYSFYLFISMG